MVQARSVTDSGWVGGLFGGAITQRDTRFNNLRVYSDARMSFADTTLGGSQAINAPPGFTVFADPPVGGVFAQPYDETRSSGKKWLEDQDTKGSYRMGAFYSEAIEQNGFYLHCRFGKPKYLGVAAFFANMYDSNLAYLARTGDYPGMIRTLGAWITGAAIFATLGTVAFGAILIIPRLLKAALNKQTSRYYYVKPTMHLYLRAVQNIVNTQLIYRRLVPTGILGYFALDRDTDDAKNKYHAERADLYSALPEIWKASGEFDIYKMINRYQLLANYQAATLDKIAAEATSPADAESRVQKFYKEALFTNSLNPDSATIANMEISLSMMEEVFAKDAGYYAGFDNANNQADTALNNLNGVYSAASASGGTAKDYDNSVDAERQALQNKQAAEASGKEGEDSPDPTQIQNWMDAGQKQNVKSFWGDFADGASGVLKSIKSSAATEIRNGSQWVTWKIDGKDTVSRSFSNSTKEPEISSTVNSATQKARSLEVNLSGGKTGFDPVDGLITGLKSAFTGALDFLHLSGIMSLYNSSVIDFPEVWDSSSTDGDDITINIPLRCWSGNDLDVFQDMIVPMSFWLAAACPIATGKQSFTHPFYLEAYSRGRFSMRNAMVTSLSMNFGVGGLGWRVDGCPLSCDISVTIRDLSRVMYMPIVTDSSVWDDDNKFSEFMAVLGGATLHERTSGIDRTIMNLANWKQSWKSAFSVGARVNQVFDLPPIRTVANLFSASAR